jgi:hypothetical protein
MARRKKRPELPPVSDEMRRTFALIAEEVGRWPGVSTKLMFGFRAVYREGVVFAMLPDKRSLEVPDAVAYKDGAEWKAFEVKGDEGIGGALAVLEKAYARSVTK